MGVARLGFAEDIVTHYLRSGLAMAKHIARIQDQTLMTIRRWRSLGFMVYIWEQISLFSKGVSFHMIAHPWFQHI